MNRVNIQLWIGNSFSTEEEYKRYFLQHDDSEDIFAPSCEFCRDIDECAYVDENLVLATRLLEPQSLDNIVNLIKVNQSEKNKILLKCADLGLQKANAFFWYINDNLDYPIEINPPYLDSYNELKYIGCFLADEEYENKTSMIETTDNHLWIGSSSQSTKKYNEYFIQDESIDALESENYIPCQFCKDVGIDWYNEDFIGYPKPRKNEIPVEELISEAIGISEEYMLPIIEKCKELNLITANALFWYQASDLSYLENLSKPYKDSYNQLRYIGKFKF